jgi:hypothetical protein
MLCRPARNRITAKPMYFQLMMSISDQMAMSGSDSQSTARKPRPIFSSMSLTAPEVWT